MKKILLAFTLLIILQTQGFAKVLFEVDYSAIKTNEALKWLKDNKYEFQRNVEKMNPVFKDGKLYFYPEEDIFAAMTYRVEVPNAKKMKIYWGVSDFHDAGNYEKGVFRETIGLTINFGYDVQPSGSIFLPDLPHFLYIFFGRYEDPNKQYSAIYYKQGSRSICPSCGKAKAGEEIVTEVDLEKEFKKAFPKEPYKMVTAFTFSIDIRDAKKLKKYHSFVRKIEFTD